MVGGITINHMAVIFTPSGPMSVRPQETLPKPFRPKPSRGGGGVQSTPERAPPSEAPKAQDLTPKETQVFVREQFKRVKEAKLKGVLSARREKEEVTSIPIEPDRVSVIPEQSRIVGPKPLQTQPGGQPIKVAKLSVFQATGQGIKRAAGLFGFGERPDSLKEVIQPFAATTTPKFQQETFVSPEGEVVDSSKFTKGQKEKLEDFGFERTTFGKVQEGRETKREQEFAMERGKSQKEIDVVFGDLQREVSAGKLSVTEAETIGRKRIKEEEVELKGKAETIFKKTPDIPGVHGPRTSRVGEFLETAALFHPVSSAISLGVQSKDAPLKDIDITKPLPTYLDTKTTPIVSFKPFSITNTGIVISSLGVVGGMVGRGNPFGRGGLRQIEKDIAFVKVEQLGKQPVSFASKIKLGEEGQATLTGFRELRGLREDIKLEGRVTKTKEGDFFIPSGVGTSKVTGQLDYNLLGGAKATQLAGVSKFRFGAKGTIIKQQGPISFTLGKTVTIPEYSTSALFQSPTTTKEFFKTIKSMGKQFGQNTQFGGRTTVSLDVGASAKIQPKFFGEDTYLGITQKGDVGFTKIIKPSTKETVQGFRGRGLQTPFEKTFGPPSPTQQLAPPKQLPFLPQPKIPTLKSTSRPSGFNIPKMVGGLGLVTLPGTTTAQMGGVRTASLAPTRLTAPKEDLRIGDLVLTGQFQQLGLVEDQVTSPRGRVSSKAILGQATAQRQGLKTKQIQSQILPPIKPATPRISIQPFAPRGFFPPIGFIPGFSIPKSKKSQRKGKRELFYQPGLASIALGIFASKKPLGSITGIVTRPLIKKKKKKRRKK